MNSSEPEKKWILIVDDESGFREMLQWYLRGMGFEVEVAENGLDAIEKISHRSFSVVITDMTMPMLDGLKLLEKLKETTPETQVIIVTGFGTVETAVYAMKQGAFDFILKPYNMDTLTKRIKEALALSNASAPKPS